MFNILNNYKTQIFVATVVIVHYALYILYYFNIVIIPKKQIDLLNSFLQIYISLFLIYKFVFLSHNSIISNLDKKVIVTSATMMLLNVLVKDFSDYFNKYIPINMNPTVMPTFNVKKSIYNYLPLSNDI
jgi:hypothetical protein